MVTLREVAARCGCSIATVSKALNGMPDISAQTARHIREVAGEMGYLPNVTARTLKTSRSNIIGLLFFIKMGNVWTHDYFSNIAAGIQSELDAENYDISPINCGEEDAEFSYVDYCRQRNYDGVVVMTAGTTTKTLMDFLQSDIPLVTIDSQFPGRHAVVSDNHRGMKDLVHYAYARGHYRIAYIHGEGTSVTAARMEGFLESCRELKLEVPSEYLKPAVFCEPELSAEATRELLALDNPPTCIIYPDDFAAIGGYNAIRAAGKSIPEDISILGYDGLKYSQAFQPRLTTLKQDVDGIAANAARLLRREIHAPRKYRCEHILLAGHILEGESVRNLR